MISDNEKEIIIRFAKKYEVFSVYLFGSSLEQQDYKDIDLAIDGIRPNLFFKFYGELLRALPKSVDLIDLSQKSLFNKLIRENGMKIYG